MIECPLCLDGTLTQHITTHSVQYVDHIGEVESHYYVCDVCGVEHCDFELVKINAENMKKFRDGL